MGLIKIAVIINMIVGIFNMGIGWFSYFINNNFEMMVFNMLCAIASLIVAGVCAIIDSKYN